MNTVENIEVADVPKVVHYAPSDKMLRVRQPMCGYAGPNDGISRDTKECTCPECLGWMQ
jgi:hypothetical protein